jgi:hypothetical protein
MSARRGYRAIAAGESEFFGKTDSIALQIIWGRKSLNFFSVVYVSFGTNGKPSSLGNELRSVGQLICKIDGIGLRSVCNLRKS